MRGEAGAWLAAAALAIALGLPFAFVGVLYKTEQNNYFCVACHLHDEKFARFLGQPSPTDLAGAHHVSRRAVRCIDCHGGADPVMRVRVWAVAGVDTLRFLVGRYEEPRRMRLPLGDAECRQCHDPIIRITPEQEEAQEGRGNSYHAITEHRTVRGACVACHISHISTEKRLQFIDRRVVLPICRRCHERMGEEVSG
jgi:predicted CXXCH cytochrome family protein